MKKSVDLADGSKKIMYFAEKGQGADPLGRLRDELAKQIDNHGFDTI